MFIKGSKDCTNLQTNHLILIKSSTWFHEESSDDPSAENYSKSMISCGSPWRVKSCQKSRQTRLFLKALAQNSNNVTSVHTIYIHYLIWPIVKIEDLSVGSENPKGSHKADDHINIQTWRPGDFHVMAIWICQHRSNEANHFQVWKMPGCHIPMRVKNHSEGIHQFCRERGAFGGTCVRWMSY